jgi:probable rRNA maturation factor
LTDKVIKFYFNNTSRLDEFNTNKIKGWINTIISLSQKKTGEINFIFCDDQFLLQMNREYLQHDYYTDIITFNYCENSLISGEIYISLDTVKRNSEEYHVTYFNEFLRVIIHGILHLIGYDDCNEFLQKEMTKNEDSALAIYYKKFH